jgi:hypothetical protein
MRLERDILSDDAKKTLDDFVAQLQRMITEGVRLAVTNGELRSDTPVESIAYQIVTICNSSDPITRDAGSFERLAQLYGSLYDIVERAFGTRYHMEPVSAPKESIPTPKMHVG